MFCIIVNRAPAAVIEVKKFTNESIDIRRKQPYPYVNHYSFHILDDEWEYFTIRLCPHPPFNAMIMLNGHEYVTRQAPKAGTAFQKEGNCFVQIDDNARLNAIAETMRAPCSVGRLLQVCNRWVYSACLCYALESDAQEQSGFTYQYSVHQVEYSRNLLFERGRVMERAFQGVIDRTRTPLDLSKIKTIFDYRHRPFKKTSTGKGPRFEMTVEKPAYDLTIFKIHFGKLTAKMYSKGERVLRIEAVAHNTKDLRCGKVIGKFPQIGEALKEIVERFLQVVYQIDVAFIDSGTLDNWPIPERVGAVRVGGLDVNKTRIRSVMRALMTLAPKPGGFTASEVAEKIRQMAGLDETEYTPRQAAYDLKKFRGKSLAQKIKNTRRYECTSDGLRQIAAFLTLREKVFIPLLEQNGKLKTGPRPKNYSQIDAHYHNIQNEMKNVFKLMKIAA